jgi:hypothetical protein
MGVFGRDGTCARGCGCDDEAAFIRLRSLPLVVKWVGLRLVELPGVLLCGCCCWRCAATGVLEDEGL